MLIIHEPIDPTQKPNQRGCEIMQYLSDPTHICSTRIPKTLPAQSTHGTKHRISALPVHYLSNRQECNDHSLCLRRSVNESYVCVKSNCNHASDACPLCHFNNMAPCSVHGGKQKLNTMLQFAGLFLIMFTVPLRAQVASQDCNPNQHYDTQRLVCLDRCGPDNKFICPVEDFCSANHILSSYHDPSLCLHRCIHACDKNSYCDHDMAECRPCDTLCDGSDMDACRAYCYDIFITLPPITSPPPWSPCTANQDYDTQRLVCLDRCGRDNELICLVEDFCSSNQLWSKNFDPPFCLNRCIQACAKSSYCDHDSSLCRPCDTLCDGSNMVACRAYCYGVFITLPPAASQPSSRSCTAKQHYDTQRRVCRDRCGRNNEIICPVEDYCSSNHVLSEHYEPSLCLNRCIRACDTTSYCDHKSADCRPCDTLCDGSDMDACRAYCYDVFTTLPLPTSQPSWSPCNANQHYDTQRLVCLDLCGRDNELICPVEEFCSSTHILSRHYDPPFCLNHCTRACDTPNYCDHDSAECRPCGALCDGSNIDACRAYCYDVYITQLPSTPQLPRERCNAKQYYDNDRQVCLDRCGVDYEDKCSVEQCCSDAVTWGKEINPPMCLSCCIQPCDGATYCDRNYHTCLPCDRLCDGTKDDLCRLHCYDVFSCNKSLNPHNGIGAYGTTQGNSTINLMENSIHVYQLVVGVLTTLDIVLIIICVWLALRSRQRESNGNNGHPDSETTKLKEQVTAV